MRRAPACSRRACSFFCDARAYRDGGGDERLFLDVNGQRFFFFQQARMSASAFKSERAPSRRTAWRASFFLNSNGQHKRAPKVRMSASAFKSELVSCARLLLRRSARRLRRPFWLQKKHLDMMERRTLATEGRQANEHGVGTRVR